MRFSNFTGMGTGGESDIDGEGEDHLITIPRKLCNSNILEKVPPLQLHQQQQQQQQQTSDKAISAGATRDSRSSSFTLGNSLKAGKSESKESKLSQMLTSSSFSLQPTRNSSVNVNGSSQGNMNMNSFISKTALVEKNRCEVIFNDYNLIVQIIISPMVTTVNK